MRIMEHESKSLLDHVSLLLAAVAVIAFVVLLIQFSVIAYSFALLALIAWTMAAPYAVRQLIKLRAYSIVFNSWGIYVLVMAYVISHPLPYPHVVGYINSHTPLLLGISYVLSAMAQNYILENRRKARRKSRQKTPVAPITT